MSKTLYALSCLVLMLLLPRLCPAAIMLFDDKLRIKGSVYEFGTYQTALKKTDREYRNDRIGLLRSKGTLELLYKAYDQGDRTVNLFGFFQYWHEAAPDIDGAMHRSIDPRARHRYQGPRERADDWINELYADIYDGPWNFRAGKQIVFWSEVEMVRTIDRINPLDLRYTTPGIDPWDEMKLGIWMLRTFYTSDLPGQLVFENIIIPGDFQRVRTPIEGTGFGGVPSPQGPERLRPRPYGQNAAVDDMFRRDQPAFNLDNMQFAFRLRGTSDISVSTQPYTLDWTVSWFHGMNQTPVARGSTLGAPTYFNFDRDSLNGYLNSLAVSRVFGAPIRKAPHERFWNYKYFDAIGASCQTYVPRLKGVLRAEVSYEMGLPENMAFPKHIDSRPGGQKVITGTTERDQVNVGITYDRPIRLMWLEGFADSSGILDCTFGWFGQRRAGDLTEIRRTFGYYDRTQSNYTVTIRTNFLHNEIIPTVRWLHNERNWGYGVLAIRYQPGRHMRYEAGYQYFYAKNPTDSTEASAENKDFAYMRIGYEF